jgi:hypothetical protein
VLIVSDRYRGLTSEVIAPGNPGYEEARQEWNRVIQRFPLAIVYCSTDRDVSNAICWARNNNIAIRIRSGGHNYEGYSVGNDLLVIDISRMNGLDIDRENNVLKVQGGVKLKQVYGLVAAEGYPFPGGTCPTVGVSGFTLGGGWGYSCRYLGLGCDSLMELELVDYTGKILLANESINADLFWACRGAGGGNFGVVVSLTFKLPPKVGRVSLVELSLPDASEDAQAAFIDAWQRWLVGLDERITIIASLCNSQEKGITVHGKGIFYGPLEEAAEILHPLASIEGMGLTLQDVSFLEAVNNIGESYADSEQFKSTGRFVYQEYDQKEIADIVGLVRTRPEGSSFAAVSVYALGGMVKNVSRDATAFYHREARYMLGIQSIWVDQQYARQNIEWVQQQFNYLKTMTTGSYVNFPYCDLTDHKEAYYGRNADRLTRIKNIYDTLDVFTFPQSIK